MTFEDAEAAQQYLVDTAFPYGNARAEMVKCEAMLRHVKSLAMKASGERTVSAQEREAYASQQYLDAIDKLFEATREAERIKAAREAAMERIGLWRSYNKNLRDAA